MPLLLGAVLFCVFAIPASAEPWMQIEQSSVTDRELRVIVKTWNYHTIEALGSGHYSDEKWWLLRVALKQAELRSQPAEPIQPTQSLSLTAAIANARMIRVIGPIAEGQDRSPGLDARSHASFLKMSRRELSRFTALLAFDHDGSLVRIRLDPRIPGAYLRETLDLSGSRLRWQSSGEYLPPAPQGSDNAGELPNISWPLGGRKYQVRRAPGGATTLHDGLSGRKIVRDWVEPVMAAIAGMPPRSDYRLCITEDENYCVVSPGNYYYVQPRPGAPAVRGTEFTLEGKTYSRLEHGFYFKTGDPKPHVFPRMPPIADPDSAEDPICAVSIDGRLFLLSSPAGKMRLRAVDGSEAFEGSVPWSANEALRRSWWHVSAPERFIALGAINTLPAARLEIFAWNYRTGAADRQPVELSDWFGVSAGTYAPRQKAIPVE